MHHPQVLNVGLQSWIAPIERMITVKESLLGGKLGAPPVQAMCEMLSIVGKKLEESTKDKRRLEGYFVILDKWSKSKVAAPPSAHIAACCKQCNLAHNFPRLQACSAAG